MMNAVTFTLREGVVCLDAEDGTSRLLDFSNRFYGLSAVATRMLRATLAAGPTTAAEQLAVEYGIPPEHMHSDLETFLADLERKRLIHACGLRTGRLDGAVCRATILPMLWCARLISGKRVRTWFLLALAWLSCRTFGWTDTVKVWRAAHPLSVTPAADPEVVMQDIDFATRSVAASHPLPTECKERALTTWALARSAGVPVELVAGVRLFPLQGHCWCIYSDVVYSDDAERCSQFKPAWRCS